MKHDSQLVEEAYAYAKSRVRPEFWDDAVGNSMVHDYAAKRYAELSGLDLEQVAQEWVVPGHYRLFGEIDGWNRERFL